MRRRTLQKLLPLLKVLNKLEEEDRRVLIPYLTHEGCSGIYECVDNILHNPNIPTEHRKQIHFELNGQRDNLRFLASKKQPAEDKKKVLQRTNQSIRSVFTYSLPMLEHDLNQKK